MTDEWATSVTVTDADQAAFVALSGDSNPLHTDPLTARRLPFGRVAVHGVHLALLALEEVATNDARTPISVRCTFRHPVAPGDDVTISVARTGADSVTMTLRHDVWHVARVEVELTNAPPRAPAPTSQPISSPGRGTPHAPSATELAASTGSIDVEADLDLVRARFPHTAAAIGDRGIAELVSLTRLVGMYVPGLHSLFSSFDLELRDPAASPDGLAYSVRRFDDRFSKATIDVEASSLTGTVTAFVRPPPIDQVLGPTAPPADAFSGQRWLVVGGSRGLGATTAMLLAAGAADVRVTYRTGADDAARVADVIGGSAHPLDVGDPDPGLASVGSDGWRPTHVAYFASPPIFDGMHGSYSHRLEDRFQDIYVDAFEGLLERLGGDRLRGVLWPSSVAVEHEVPGMAEYATVKRRGEAFCADLARRHPVMLVATPRFPRLLTDQTTSFVPVEVDDTPTTVLRELLAFSG